MLHFTLPLESFQLERRGLSLEEVTQLPSPIPKVRAIMHQFFSNRDYHLEEQVGRWFVDEQYSSVTFIPRPDNGECENAPFMMWARVADFANGQRLLTREEIINAYLKVVSDSSQPIYFPDDFREFVGILPIYGLELSFMDTHELRPRFGEHFATTDLLQCFLIRTTVIGSSRDYGGDGPVLYLPLNDAERKDIVPVARR